ncbi:hypothetical protein [Nitrosovibrio sp. Nv4]|nr:hypothetical protein [Nitrosovibrio sp. Nv4]
MMRPDSAYILRTEPNIARRRNTSGVGSFWKMSLATADSIAFDP